jgi:hypothetical protein
VAIGLAHDARPYLVAMARPDDALVELGAYGFQGGILTAFERLDVVVGMLPPHRRLASAADVRAFALDPMTPPELASLLVSG